VLTSRICDQRAYPTSFALDLASPLLVGVTELALICGTVIFAGLFVCAISLQFFLVNDAELTSSFAYGGSYATSQPASIVRHRSGSSSASSCPSPSRRTCPRWRSCTCRPAAAAVVGRLVHAGGRGLGVAEAMCLWRWKTRHYQGGGGWTL
jgi:ABC-2 type transport system permease protein